MSSSSPSVYPELCSPYLSGGIAEDRFAIRFISAENRCYRAVVSMTQWYCSPTDDNSFHLSAPVALQIVSQLGIIGGHLALGLDKKQGEVWMKDYQMVFASPVRNPEHITCSLEIVDERASVSRPGMVSFTFLISVNDGAFRGRMTLVFQR